MDIANILLKVLVLAPGLILAITLHEAAHAYAAKRFGDSTAYSLGRMTLNPIKHIDPIGTLLVPGVLLLMGAPFIFGWAKPVPVNFGQLRPRRFGMGMVAFAGPLTNILLAFASALLMWPATLIGGAMGSVVMTALYYSVFINLILAALNLFPLPPLDGGRIVGSFLPPRLEHRFTGFFESGFGMFPLGFIVLLVLLFTGILWKILMPFIGLGFAAVSLVAPAGALPGIF